MTVTLGAPVLRPAIAPAMAPPTALDPAAVRQLVAGAVDLTGAAPLELDEALQQLAGLELPPGATVLLAVGTGRNLLNLHLACVLAGLAPVAVPAVSRSDRLRRIAHTVGAAALVAAHPPYEQLEAAPLGAIGPYRAVSMPGPHARRPGTVVLPTSGTSGIASACVHRVDSLLRNARRHAEAVGLRPDDALLVSLPLFFSFALVAQAYAALQLGARLVIAGPPFTAAGFVQTAAAAGVSSCSITPTAARMLLRRGVTLPRTVRMLTVGGDRLDPGHVEGLRRANPAAELYVTYGLTEAGPRVSTLAAHDEPRSRLDSAGRMLAGTFAHLRDRQADGSGELLVESDTLLIDKLGGIQGRRTTLAPGVLATGDRFAVDDDGYLRFIGRLSDIIVVRGEKVCLASVRAVVNAVPGVLGCATVVCADRGETCFDLEVRADPEATDVADLVRSALGANCLGAERPRHIRMTVEPGIEFCK